MDCPRIVRSIFDPLYYFAHIQRQTIGLNGYLEAYVPSLHVGGPGHFSKPTVAQVSSTGGGVTRDSSAGASSNLKLLNPLTPLNPL